MDSDNHCCRCKGRLILGEANPKLSPLFVALACSDYRLAKTVQAVEVGAAKPHLSKTWFLLAADK